MISMCYPERYAETHQETNECVGLNLVTAQSINKIPNGEPKQKKRGKGNKFKMRKVYLKLNINEN